LSRDLASSPTLPAWAVGPQWVQLGLRQPGWLLLPLRGFLGVTFLYASLQKLANPAYLRASDPASVVGQMRALKHTSPIGPLLGLSLHAPALVGLMIALGELAVAVGVLLGLWTRLAALGGMALSLTFFLTVSWSTTPYYYGSDIVFFFAWSVIAAFGSAGVLSLDSLFHSRARQLAGVSATGSAYTIDGDRLRRVCSLGDGCGLDPDTGCRIVLATRSALVVGMGALSLGGLAAVIGRLAGGTKSGGTRNTLGGGPVSPGPTAKPTQKQHHHSAHPAPAQTPSGVALGSASQVPVGQAGRFTDPASGQPAYVVHTSGNNFVAFSAVCTHAGCTLGFDPSNMEFICPCHGGSYSARTGQVTGGPPPSPLPSIPVRVVNGTIRVD
jgi:thiosulfate dehydrogenase [quinone] large subunit